MPATEVPATAGVKRKRANGDIKKSTVLSKKKAKRASDAPSESEDDSQSQILELEAQILESRRHYNNIAKLLELLALDKTYSAACVSLCRVFVRLMAEGALDRRKEMEEKELVIVQWLKSKYSHFVGVLSLGLRDFAGGANFNLTLLMRLVKAEAGVERLQGQRDTMWRTGLFADIVRRLLHSRPEHGDVREDFLEKYIQQYDDVRFYFLQAIVVNLSVEDNNDPDAEFALPNALEYLSAIEQVPTSAKDLDNFLGAKPESKKHVLNNAAEHRSMAKEAWLAVLRSSLTPEQRKKVLGIMTTHIVPHFAKVETLMDFLTDSYNAGGATSLLALSGLFHLMQEKNLDYPSFYPKLYSLLDENLLHSKHRSRFFRLLDTFLGSSHLPAALVASFIKRLSRLALHAPPAAIVAVVPWVYNMLRAHPVCTFMIHREVRDPAWKEELAEQGMDDPFDMDEADPMQTDAIESSLWEIETLQSHYHPNVAKLATIISEQFTKPSYDLEDFLGYSYDALIEADLGKDMKKTPVVEFEIPKRIFTAEETDLNPLGQLLLKALEQHA